MLRWKERRRRTLRNRPLPADQRAFLMQNVPLASRLPASDWDELAGHIQVLLGEKRIEGAGGLEITDEMKLIVVAQAGVLLLHRETDYFPRLDSIVLYPGEYVVQDTIETDDGLIEEFEDTRVGEAWSLGTLVLSWEEVEADLASDIQNVVLHEFAHHLDAESGEMNGAPVLRDPDFRRRWAGVMSSAYDRLIEADERGEETVLDPYGADDPGEFFAVAVEAFFLTPGELSDEEPELYAILRDHFRQDPIGWSEENPR